MFRLYYAPGTCALMKGPWVMGDQYMICDPYLFTIASWIEGDGVDTTKIPRVMEHRARMLARAAVQKAVAAEGTQIPGRSRVPRTLPQARVDRLEG